MSLDISIYLGCYIVAKKKTKETQKTKRICPKGHHKSIGQSFCPICGDKTIDLVTTKTETLTLNRLMDDELIPYNFYDRLINTVDWEDGETETFVPNSIYDNIDLNDRDEDFSLMAVDMVQEVENFKEEYKSEIKLIDENYESHKIQYGICYNTN